MNIEGLRQSSNCLILQEAEYPVSHIRRHNSPGEYVCDEAFRSAQEVDAFEDLF